MNLRHLFRWGAAPLTLGILTTAAHAQHHVSSPDATPAVQESMDAKPMEMPRPDVLGLPMSRHGSGTGWLPDASPMRAAHARVGGWDVMLHGNLFVGYDYQGSDAGDDQVVSQNWAMGMASRPVAGGMFRASAMLSLEPLTVGEDGYPLLLQTGETVDGEPLIDRQHPHDLFMELATRYAREIEGGVAFEVYTALAGEPALGPVAFAHRPSAMADPLAPLSHHWQDSTHISFGVVTAGLFTRTAKLEGSVFNGREPDEQRYDLDLRTPDSVSARLSVNPSANWSLQASYARLDSPESLEPMVSVERATTSATHAVDLGGHRSWTSTAVLGVNMPSEGPLTHGGTVETALDLAALGTTFLRAEHVVKSGADFAFPAGMEDETLSISALSLGHVHSIAKVAGTDTGLGVRGSIAYVDAQLEERYGTRTPLGFMAFIQFQPALMH